jgi:glycosyltransferase involved in cell wall biosynthesis
VPSISIIIRCKNEAHAIEETLRRISEQDIDLPYETIVVDSGSTDGTLAIAGRYRTRIFEIPAQDFTFGYALNYGIERAEGTIIVNVSAHCTPTDTAWLKELVAPLRGGEAGATFGRQVAIKGVNAFEEVSLNKHFPEHDDIKGRLPFSNANCAFLKEMWVDTRFDEELPSWEDYLWYLLMKDKYGFRYCPKGAVYHTHPFSFSSVSRRAYFDGRAFTLIRRKYEIDLLDGVCPTWRLKIKWFWADVKNHIKLFRQEGYEKYILLVPALRALAYMAYWRGYHSVK